MFVAVIIDHTNHRVLEVLENREKATVKAYLEAGRASGLFAALEEVTTDMWDGYVEAVNEAFEGQVRGTVDRFHVMKNFQEQLTAARREIQRDLNKEEAKALKGSRWLWLTNDENLTADQRRELESLCQQFPRLGKLREQRESLRAIFEDGRLRTAEGGVRRLQAWITQARELGLQALNAFCQTLENWLDKIANYFIARSSNGPTEGFNHGLRVILWRAFGMTNFHHFRARVLHAFGTPRPQ
jgi:transposase